MLFAFEQRPVQFRPAERLLIVRIGRIALPDEIVELLATSVADRFDQRLIRV
jgi:hypothetical protein